MRGPSVLTLPKALASCFCSAKSNFSVPHILLSYFTVLTEPSFRRCSARISILVLKLRRRGPWGRKRARLWPRLSGLPGAQGQLWCLRLEGSGAAHASERLPGIQAPVGFLSWDRVLVFCPGSERAAHSVPTFPVELCCEAVCTLTSVRLQVRPD